MRLQNDLLFATAETPAGQESAFFSRPQPKLEQAGVWTNQDKAEVLSFLKKRPVPKQLFI